MRYNNRSINTNNKNKNRNKSKYQSDDDNIEVVHQAPLYIANVNDIGKIIAVIIIIIMQIKWKQAMIGIVMFAHIQTIHHQQHVNHAMKKKY